MSATSNSKDVHALLVHILHPYGLHCPQGHRLANGQAPHRTRRSDLPDYRCRECGAVYNLFSGTHWNNTRYSCATVFGILRGVAQGRPTTAIAAQLGINRASLARRRHLILEEIEALASHTTRAILENAN